MLDLPPPPSHYERTLPNLEFLSTEKTNKKTENLSQEMQKNCMRGLELLHEVDKGILEGFELFAMNYLPSISVHLKEKRAEGGRCFLIGSGSSGRIAIDLAAKCNSNEIIGLIAGGDSAFIRAKENFEDSEKEGRDVLKGYQITSHDIVFLISASGSSTFNFGCAKEARKSGADVYYFYNSREIPEKTRLLFDREGVFRLLIDIGPPAIAGSTRLQSASIAELALGCLLSWENPEDLLNLLRMGNAKIAEHLQDIAKIVQLEYEVFSNPNANFKKLRDETDQGYVTFIAGQDSLREVMIDTTETAPTFSTNPPRPSNEAGKKRAEFQAFMIHQMDNFEAWKALLGRDPTKENADDLARFLLDESGFAKRPMGPGNLVIGVSKEVDEDLFPFLVKAKETGAKTAFISLGKSSEQMCWDASLFLELEQKDPYGIVSTILLKQILNLISNGSMILMNKVFGNQMIDVNASNNKLIDRASRLTQDIFYKYLQTTPFDRDFVQRLIHSICQKKKEYEEQNLYTPSPVKIAVTMLQKEMTFEEAIEWLHYHNENIEEVFL